ncbi:MAG: amidohydrolase family protein [Aestuariibacter sp.]
MKLISKPKALLVSCLSIGLALSSAAIYAQEDSAITDENKEWDVLNPPFELKTLAIETDEVTWSSLDVTPDGKTIVFDMLGDLYQVPMAGGNATPLVEDFAWNIQPAVSPDGKQVAFISDRGGVSNLWVMNIDGSELKQLSEEKNNLIHSPAWSPDGNYIAAMKGIMSRRSIPAGEIWLYHKAGGKGVQVKARVNGKKDQKNIADPAFSPDGKYLYYTQDVTSGSVFSYNRDPLKGIFAVTRYDLEKGEEERYISGTGGAIVPTPSPDGKKVAFLRRVKNKTALFLKDIKSGTETPLYLEMERDMQEGFGSEGYFAYFDWTPDSQHIVFWTNGKFHKINVESAELATIDVKVTATKQYADAIRYEVDVAPDTFNPKMLRWSQTSPDGKKALFQTLGKIYVRDLASGETKRLTKQTSHDEFYPRFSNDGKHIIYTTWNDLELGSVRIVSAKGGRSKVVTQYPGHYVQPSFSPSGDFITYRKITGGNLLTPKWSVDPGIYVYNVEHESETRVSKSGWNPHFAGDDTRVYFTTSVAGSDYPERQLVSVNIDGNDKREHLYGADNVEEYRLSHDKNWVAFTHQYKVYVAPFKDVGKRLSISGSDKAVAVKQISKNAGEYLNWSPNNDSLSWSHGPHVYQQTLANAFDFIGETPEEQPEASKTNLSFEVKAHKPEGYKALVGGTVVTMRDADQQQEILENATVLVKDNRIVAVGSADDIEIPAGALMINAKGKTVIPGLIDTHAHGSQGTSEIIPQRNWELYSLLAFGVTTIHDPSNDTTEIFAASELQRAGQIAAPRIYSTGTILYGAELLGYKAIINNYEDAKFHMQRMKDVGAISVKSYNQPARSQRQQVLAAAREMGMMVVPEGGGKLHQNLTMLIDGHTGLEHSLPIAKAYDDVTQLWSATEFGYTPTFVVSYGGMMGEEYFYDRMEVWKNERLMRYTPSYLVDKRSIRRPTAPDNQYNHVAVAEYAKELRDNGVSVHIGAHGQREGLAAHWEMWIMAQGGFTPWEALRAGTIDGAKHLALDKDIGSIEVGKLADLVVIDGNVLDNLSQSEMVQYTMVNGRIFEASTMNEFGVKAPRPKFFFEDDNQLFMPEETLKALEAKQKRHHWVH